MIIGNWQKEIFPSVTVCPCGNMLTGVMVGNMSCEGPAPCQAKLALWHQLNESHPRASHIKHSNERALKPREYTAMQLLLFNEPTGCAAQQQATRGYLTMEGLKVTAPLRKNNSPSSFFLSIQLFLSRSTKQQAFWLEAQNTERKHRIETGRTQLRGSWFKDQRPNSESN